MGQQPQELRQDIDRTRQRMDRTLDEIQERVSPSRIVQRRTDRMRSAVTGVRERVMGTADEARTSASQRMETQEGRMRQVQGQLGEAGESVRSTVQQAPETARDRTRGNPLAAGLIAFGAGLLAGSLLPESRQEQQVAEGAMDRLEPAKEQLTEAGQQVASDVQEDAQRKVEETKQSVAAAADHVRGDAQGAASDLKQEARGRAEDVRDTAQGS